MSLAEDWRSQVSDFLRQWREGGPWILTAITPDRKSILTETFTSLDDVTAWLEEHNGQRNIYFHVNPALRALRKKAEREDIAELAWLHVDIDPRVGEDLNEERQRALRLLQSPPGDVPPPTCIIFSGGGYQGFWRLGDPMPIQGELSRAEEAKRYNLQLELVFGADNCHNVDRIMRLPGTLNIPDAKKRRKGRTETMAELVEFHDDRVYTLDQFVAAPLVQMQGDQSFAPEQVRVSGNLPRLNTVDDLDEWGVPDRTKVIIVQGRHPEEGAKQGDDSRSAWLFDAVCSLVRCEVPDDVIYTVITDPEFGISDSVLDKGSNTEKYALRQIAQAREHAIDPRLSEMNQRFAVVSNIGGRCRVVEEQEDAALHRSRLTLQTFQDFRNRHMHRQVDIGTDARGNPKSMPLGNWWLQHPRRRQYDRIVFNPGGDVSGAYNLWKGFACQARPGDCSLYLEHLRVNICQGVDEHYRYLLGWMARTVQRPDSPGQVAVVLRGKQGTGKGFFVKELGRLFGRHFLHVSNPLHLVGQFNAHLRDCVLLFGDEAFYAGDKKHESVLKTLITEELITIEAKGVDAEAAPNFAHVVLASNHDWVVPAGADERRFFVLDVGDAHKQDARYFGRIAEQMAAGGREALLHHLMTWDLTDFEVRNVPQTGALRDQKLLSLSPVEEWWYGKLQDGVLLSGSGQGEPWPEKVKKEALLADYVEQMKAYNVARRANPTALGKFLRKVCPGIRSIQLRQGQFIRPYFYLIPSLAEARAGWEEVYGQEEWPEPEQRELPVASEPEEEIPF